MKFNIY